MKKIKFRTMKRKTSFTRLAARKAVRLVYEAREREEAKNASKQSGDTANGTSE